jgi:hypothetical protein
MECPVRCQLLRDKRDAAQTVRQVQIGFRQRQPGRGHGLLRQSKRLGCVHVRL